MAVEANAVVGFHRHFFSFAGLKILRLSGQMYRRFLKD